MLVSSFTSLPYHAILRHAAQACFLAYSEGIGEFSHQAMGQSPSVVGFYKNPPLLRWGVCWFPAFDEISRFGTCTPLCL
jgi:hypothetical protein